MKNALNVALIGAAVFAIISTAFGPYYAAEKIPPEKPAIVPVQDGPFEKGIHHCFALGTRARCTKSYELCITFGAREYRTILTPEEFEDLASCFNKPKEGGGK